MAENFYTILTNVGKAKIANATALGTKVNFTILKVGDSNGTYYNPAETQENLVHEVWQGNINSITTDAENPNWIVVEVVIPSNVGGFVIREVGIFDDEGDMLAIGKYPETYKPQVADGSTKDITIRMILEVSNSASVTLKVDPTVTLATKADFTALAGDGRTTETVKGNADALKAHKQDYEYQTPTVTGTQIQLIKKSDTKILKFKLDADLTGGNITISTDAGATDKPLVDTDDTQLTSLEKGFVEVVADADFFILRNKGLSPGEKQDLIDIANNAEAYNSTTRANLISTINSVLGATLLASATWNDINNYLTANGVNFIPANIKKDITIFGKKGTVTIESLGDKKWASGITRSGDSQITCEYVTASDYNLGAYALKIPITFEPSLVVAIATSIYKMTIYTNSNDGYYQKTDKLISYNGTHGGGDTANCKGDINPLGLASDGFTVPVSVSGGAADYTWIAIE